MEVDLHNGELRLAENAPIRLRRARGLKITCTVGCVWVTVAGEALDIFLHTGESHVVAGNGLVLLEAVGCGSVHLGPSLAALPAREPQAGPVRASLPGIWVKPCAS